MYIKRYFIFYCIGQGISVSIVSIVTINKNEFKVPKDQLIKQFLIEFIRSKCVKFESNDNIFLPLKCKIIKIDFVNKLNTVHHIVFVRFSIIFFLQLEKLLKNTPICQLFKLLSCV